MFEKEGKPARLQSLDEIIGNKKSQKVVFHDDSMENDNNRLLEKKYNGRSFQRNRSYSPYPRNRNNNLNNFNINSWSTPRRDSMYNYGGYNNQSYINTNFPTQWGICRCAQCCPQFGHNVKNNLDAVSNYSYNSRNSNYYGNLRRAKSCESVASASSFRSNFSRKSYNNGSNFSINMSNNGKGQQNRRRYRKDRFRSPLDKSMQIEMKEMQTKFTKKSLTSPLHRFNVNAQLCVPVQFNTEIKLSERFNSYYKPLE